VHFNFIGRFTPPQEEAAPLTPEELAEEAKRQKRLAYQREANKRWYAKKREEELRRQAIERGEIAPPTAEEIEAAKRERLAAEEAAKIERRERHRAASQKYARRKSAERKAEHTAIDA
jgi:hypothetical protein